MSKGTVIRNFSRYAHLYDKYADIQRLAAGKLIDRLNGSKFENILELGCGTGNYTRLLKDRFGHASIKAVDISAEMIGIAARKLRKSDIEFIVCDAEYIELSERQNLITASSVFQWFEDIEGAIAKYKKTLVDDGVIAFSFFGPSTFQELNISLGRALNSSLDVSSRNFFGKKALEAILKRHLREVAVEEVIVKERYPSLMELLNKIRYTGARGSGLGGNFTWSRGLARRTEEIYRREFGRIEASYQIFLCKAMK